MTTNENVRVHFLGGAETVTGSKYLIETPEFKIMVDCGLFQGLKKLRELNWQYMPVVAAEIDVVLLTHGHLDHTGFLPRLVKMGFKGNIMGTDPTLDIAEVILRDSAHIQEEQAERANREGYSKHKPAMPLYDTEDVNHTVPHFRAVNTNEWIPLSKNIRVRYRYVGHIIGATFIELEIGAKRLVFSGDVGRQYDVLMYPPEKPDRADVLFMETTYGNRLHPEESVQERLANLINETVKNQGTLIIPSFAVERAQGLMLLLWRLQEQGDIPKVPMILDSPMGASVLDVFKKHRKWHKLQEAECDAMCAAFTVNRDFKDTLKTMTNKDPKVVIAGSGMVTGGRVLNYLEKYIELPQTTVLLSGFQAEGTRGRKLLEHTTELKFFGNYHPVRARIEHMNSLSAHADQAGLLDWLSEINEPPKYTFLVHGEAQAADAFRVKIKDTYNWEAVLPGLYQIVELFDE